MAAPFFPVSLFALLFVLRNAVWASSHGAVYAPPAVDLLTERFSRVAVNQSYEVIFGGSHVRATFNGSGADLTLDKSGGSGMVSRNTYYHGFFNAAIKLPDGFTSGVVVAFYLSNADVFPHNHDEIDIELLGHEKGRQWVLQTNLYGNGSVRTGREEKFYLWFDPTQNFHDYSILWNDHHIVFFVDNVPVREVVHNTAIAPVYPSKAMSAYITIWDGSQWATHGGKYPVDYKFAPFVAAVRGVEMEGCVRNEANACSGSGSGRSPSSLDPVDGQLFAKLSSRQMSGLDWARGKHMVYSYCRDKLRYRVSPPECSSG